MTSSIIFHNCQQSFPEEFRKDSSSVSLSFRSNEMETNVYHPSLLLIPNDTSLINLHSPGETSLHLFILAAVWIVLLLTIVFGTTGNVLVLYVYISRDDNKTCTFFIKILASVDLVICLLLAPLELYQTTTGKVSRREEENVCERLGHDAFFSKKSLKWNNMQSEKRSI